MMRVRLYGISCESSEVRIRRSGTVNGFSYAAGHNSPAEENVTRAGFLAVACHVSRVMLEDSLFGASQYETKHI
jgi:hypothetical protein